MEDTQFMVSGLLQSKKRFVTDTKIKTCHYIAFELIISFWRTPELSSPNCREKGRKEGMGTPRMTQLCFTRILIPDISARLIVQDLREQFFTVFC